MFVVEIILLVIALAALVVLALDLRRGPRRRQREREYLERLSAEESDEDPTAAEELLRPPSGRVGSLLRSAGLGLGVIPFLALCFALGVLAFLGILSLSSRAWLAAILVGILAFWIPTVILREWARWRSWRFEERLVEAVEFMASALSAGENPAQALASAAAASRQPVRGELEAVGRRLGAGVRAEGALAPLVRRYDSEGTRLFVQTLAVKWLAGGDLAALLRGVAEVMRERVRVSLRLRSELAGVQISAVIIAILPYALIPFFLAMRPTWAPSLMGHPLGPTLLGFAVALQLFGFLWLRRVLRVEL
jgi:Flp pilus assembly protein TadB